MFYYLYEIRNNLNGKIYVGVHKTKKMNDGYMGSGKGILLDIEKYGNENFTKTILETFENSEDMYAREKEVVTKEFLSREDVYNLRRGGYGGFDHINSVLPKERLNLIKLKENISNGITKCGGDTSMFFTDDSYKKIMAGSKKGSKKWSELSPLERKHLDGNYKKGDDNNSYGTHIYIDSTFVGELPQNNVIMKNRFKEGEQPLGWITIIEWKELRKRKSGTFGMRWYNNGVDNFYIKRDDPNISNLKKGRLGKLFSES